MTKDEALKLALEALDDMHIVDFPLEDLRNWNKAINAIKEALAQPDHIRDATKMMAQPVQEPVARVIDNGTPEGGTEWIPFVNRVEPLKTGDLLYTTPPQRPWVGLTEDEAISAVSSVLPVPSTGGQTHHLQIQYKYALEIAQTIEDKLKQKNT